MPVFCNQAHVIAAGSGELDDLADTPDGASLPRNEYLDALEQVHDLEAFAAVIYSSNFDYEAVETSTTPESHAPQYTRERESTTTEPVPKAPAVELADRVDESRTEPIVSDSELQGSVDAPQFEAVEGEKIPTTATLEGAGAFEAAWNKACRGP